MYNQSTYNPGVPGSTDQAEGLIDARSPYPNLKDAQGNSVSNNNTWFAGDMPLKKLHSGIGVNILVDNNGLFEKSTSFSISYAYQLQMGDGKLGIGLMGNIKMLSYDFSKAIFPSGLLSTSSGTDDLITSKGKTTSNIFTATPGLYYTKNDLYFGASATNITFTKTTFFSQTVKYFVPNVYFIAGFTYKPANPLIVILPSMQYKSPIVNWSLSGSQLQLSTVIEYSKLFLCGLAYTTDNDLTLMLGAKGKEETTLAGLTLIVAKDFETTSKLRQYNNGSIEFVVKYTFSMKVAKRIKTYKSVRFL